MQFKNIVLMSAFAILPIIGCDAGDLGTDLEGTNEEVDTMLAALPTAEMLTVHYPGLNTAEQVSLARSTEAEASCDAASEEDSAAFYQQGCKVASFVNGVVNDVLGMVANITAHQPSQATDGGWMWGPAQADDGATQVFFMRQNGEGGYEYALQGLPPDAGEDTALITMIAGEIFEGNSATDNVGDFKISYDNIATVHPSQEAGGRAYYVYDRLDTQTGVEAQMEDLLTGDGQVHNIKVDYDVNSDNSGTLRYGVTDDIYQPEDAPEDTTAQELGKVNTRWLSNGAGRSDVTVTGGDLGEATAYRTQCWDVAYLSVYDAFYLDATQTYYRSGDSAQCVFEDPEFL